MSRDQDKSRMRLSLGLCAALCLAAPQVLASGIPTVDIASIAQMVQNAFAQAAQAKAALDEVTRGIDEARRQYEDIKSITTGNDKLGNFLNNRTLNRVLPMENWASMYDNVKDIVALRERYRLQSNDPLVQAKFDRMLTAADTLERVYSSAAERVRNAEKLRAKLNEVQTPQQKSDLQLRFQLESLEIQNQQFQLANLQMLQEQQRKMEEKNAAKKYLIDITVGKKIILSRKMRSMNKIVCALVMAGMVSGFSLAGCESEQEKLAKIRLQERAEAKEKGQEILDRYYGRKSKVNPEEGIKESR